MEGRLVVWPAVERPARPAPAEAFLSASGTAWNAARGLELVGAAARGPTTPAFDGLRSAASAIAPAPSHRPIGGATSRSSTRLSLDSGGAFVPNCPLVIAAAVGAPAALRPKPSTCCLAPVLVAMSPLDVAAGGASCDAPTRTSAQEVGGSRGA